jgi:hypothetical protein
LCCTGNKFCVGDILTKKETENYPMWTDSGSGASADFSCWNPIGDNLLTSIPVNGYNGLFTSHVFTGAVGVLDKPTDFTMV